MSLSPYLIAIRNRVRTLLIPSAASRPELWCDITPDGKPSPIAGEEFFSVHPSRISNSSNQINYLDERCDLSITYTRRTGVSPYDRLSACIVTPNINPGPGIPPLGAWETARIVAVHLASQVNAYEIMDAANAIIGSTHTGFCEPMILKGMNWLGVKGSEWFIGAEPDPEDPATGIAIEIQMGGARRVQSLIEGAS